MASKILVIVFIFFCFELGLFLIIFPWSRYWENNLFLSYAPFIRDFVLSNYFRGAVSGLGIVDIGIGIYEAMHFKLMVSQMSHE